MKNSEENKASLVPKDILEMCEFEEDYTDAWAITEEVIENVNTLKGFYRDYGKGNLDEFFDTLNEFYRLFVIKNYESSFHFWLHEDSRKSVEVFLKTDLF